jgi:hypothetical protein
MALLGPNGSPISTDQYKKAPSPKTGEAFGAWAGRDITYATMPGGGLIGFDLSRLRVEDYRVMRDHYQVNASLAVLSFMQHQSEWHIECENEKIAEFCEVELRNNWTSLNRALATANWAGYSPNVLQWENDLNQKAVVLDKVKDLIPEECAVNWKLVEGYAPPNKVRPKFKIYDGMIQAGQPYAIPVENSLWYPLLMENGDYYGRKLLRPAFISWYFSILVHLFANRYYERFGEPVPIGRASFEDELDLNGTPVRGNKYMLSILEQLRNRSVVVLPNDATEFGNGRREYDYDIEYLESQMRGADFERYLTRLDEEISIGLFTPILLLRTADVGSYNLGVGHMQMYLWMLNAMNNDRAEYINKYVLSRMADYNFSPNSPRPKIKFRKLGNQNAELLRALVTELTRQGSIKPDIRELGEMAGMSFEEIDATVSEDPDSTGGDDVPVDDRIGRPERAKSDGPAGPDKARDTAVEITARVAAQVKNAFASKNLNSAVINMGYKKRMAECVGVEAADRIYGRMDAWLEDAVTIDQKLYKSPENFMGYFTKVLDAEIESAVCS